MLAADDDAPLGPDDREGDEALRTHNMVSNILVLRPINTPDPTHLDLLVQRHLLRIILVVVVRIHPQIMELELLPNPLLKRRPLLHGQRVALRNHRHHVHKLAQLLQHDDVDRLERVSARLDEEQAAVDARVLQVALPLRRQLLAQVRAVLVLDVLDDRIPAPVVVDQVAVARRVDDIEPQAHAVLLDDVRDGLDLGGAANGLVGGEAAFAVDEVGREDCVDERGFAEAGLTWRGSES